MFFLLHDYTLHEQSPTLPRFNWCDVQQVGCHAHRWQMNWASRRWPMWRLQVGTANLYQCNGWGDVSLDCKSEAFAVSCMKAVESPVFDRDNIWVLIRDCCFVFFRDWNHAMSNKPESYGCTNRMFFPLICAIDFTISFKSVASHSDFSGLHVFLLLFDLFDSCWALRSGGWLWRGRQEQDTGVGGWSNYWDLKRSKFFIPYPNGAGIFLVIL